MMLYSSNTSTDEGKWRQDYPYGLLASRTGMLWVLGDSFQEKMKNCNMIE